MEWLEQSMDNCSVQRTLDVIGEKWTFLVLREAFHGVRRFAEMQEHTGAPRPVLAKRLAKLVDEDLLVRVPYQEPGQRERYEYQLTPKGLDLYPTVNALREWADRYLADPDGPARTFLHRGCGAAVHVPLVCEQGHVVGFSDVESQAGPGARLAHERPA